MHANKYTIDLWPYSYTDMRKYKLINVRNNCTGGGGFLLA